MSAYFKPHTSLASGITDCFAISRVFNSRDIQLDLLSHQIGLLMLFGGSLEYKSNHALQSLRQESGMIFNHLHIPKIVASNRPVNGLFVKIDVHCLQKILSTIRYSPNVVRSVSEPVGLLPLPDCKETRVLISSLELYFLSNATPCSDVLFESKLLEVFWLLNVYGKYQFDRFIYSYLIPDRTQFDTIITRHYKDNVSIERLAVIAGLSVSTFKRKFQEAYQCSPKRWIQGLRLNEAKSLLEFTEKSISEIGYEVGFENISHFIQSFKAKFGVTPKVMRDRLATERISVLSMAS